MVGPGGLSGLAHPGGRVRAGRAQRPRGGAGREPEEALGRRSAPGLVEAPGRAGEPGAGRRPLPGPRGRAGLAVRPGGRAADRATRRGGVAGRAAGPCGARRAQPPRGHPVPAGTPARAGPADARPAQRRPAGHPGAEGRSPPTNRLGRGGPPGPNPAGAEEPLARGGPGLRREPPLHQHVDAHHRRPQSGHRHLLRRRRAVRRPGPALRRRHPGVEGAGHSRPAGGGLGGPHPVGGDPPVRGPVRHRRGPQGPGRDVRGAEPLAAARRPGRLSAPAVLRGGSGRERDAGADPRPLGRFRRGAGGAAAGAGLLPDSAGPGLGHRPQAGPRPRRRRSGRRLRAGDGDLVPAAVRGLRRGQGPAPLSHQRPLHRPLPEAHGPPPGQGSPRRPGALRRPGHVAVGRHAAALAGGQPRQHRLGRARLQRRPLHRRPGGERTGRGSDLAAAHRRRDGPGAGGTADRRGPRGCRSGGLPVAVSARVRHHLRGPAGVAAVGGPERPLSAEGKGPG